MYIYIVASKTSMIVKGRHERKLLMIIIVTISQIHELTIIN